jgi:multisubunit Na+/H+ antiporter MnhC subunit
LPVTTIVVLAAVVIAFAIFGAALAWGAHQTAMVDRQRREPAE